MSFLKTLIASSFLPCSSATTNWILLPLMPPAALISSAASSKPLRIATPYWAAPPDRASATPILRSAACAEAQKAAKANSVALNGSCLIGSLSGEKTSAKHKSAWVMASAHGFALPFALQLAGAAVHCATRKHALQRQPASRLCRLRALIQEARGRNVFERHAERLEER